MRKKTHDQFISEMTIANPSVLVLGTYVNSSTKIEVRCVNCNHVWSAVPDSLAHGHGCPVCAGNQRKTSQQFVSEMHTLNPFVEILGEYETAVTPLKVRCTICGYEWLSKPNRLLRGAQCTNCIKPHTSFMEQFIFRLLSSVVSCCNISWRIVRVKPFICKGFSGFLSLHCLVRQYIVLQRGFS